ncbi:MAG: hypothetical protein WC942_10310 [Clostridia bacterium]|jgi:hypothetical protein
MDTNIKYIDTDIRGLIDNSGNLTTLTGIDAIKNSVITWLTSFRNDIIRSPGKGGYLTQHLYKPMSEYNRQLIRDSIVDGLYQDYFPTVRINSIQVSPDYEKKEWTIFLDIYVSEIKEEVTMSTTVKNFV